MTAPPTKTEVLDAATPALTSLPPPGHGQTAARLHGLFTLARTHDVSLARLVEAHIDACAILREAGREPEPDRLYGVWASAGSLRADLRAGELDGTKPFCSGVGIVDRALIAAEDARGRQLLLDVATDTADQVVDHWHTDAMAATATRTVRWDRARIADHQIVGAPDWYLTRTGFWHGACGPAACWAGAASGLVDDARQSADLDPHQAAHLGAMVTAAWMFEAVLERVAADIDRAPDDATRARARALTARAAVASGVQEITVRHRAAFGPRSVVAGGAVAQRLHDVELYVMQHHGDADLAVLGHLSGGLSSRTSSPDHSLRTRIDPPPGRAS